MLSKEEAEDLAHVLSEKNGTPPAAFEAWKRIRARWYPEMGITAETSVNSVAAFVLRKVAEESPDAR